MSAYTSPLDLLDVYITPSGHGVGQRLSLDTIDNDLSRMPLRPVLRLLALTSFRADRSITDTGERAALARDLLPDGPTRDRAMALIEQGAFLVSSQHSLALAVRALVVCPEESSTLAGDLPRRLGRLLLALGDHLGAPNTERDEQLILELVRVGLHYRLHGIFDWYATAEGVFFQTLPTMTGDKEFIDVPQLLLDELGLDLPTFWALSAAFGIAVMGGERLQTFPAEIVGLDPEVTTTWAGALTQSVETARTLAAPAVKSWSGWSHGVFYAKPILADITDGEDYVMRPRLIAHKATITGMYHLVFDLLAKRGSDDHLRWSRLFGRTIERYGRDRLTVELGEARVSFPDDRPPAPNQPPACDVLVREDDGLLALDFVHRILSLPTQTTGSPAALARDIEVAIIEKAEQVDATLEEVADAEVTRLFPAVVMSGPLPLTPPLHARITEMVVSKCKVIGHDSRCRPLAVLELHELNMLLATAAANDASVCDVLDAWLDSAFGGNNFRDWLVTQDEIKPGRAHSDGPWYDRIRALFPNGLDPAAAAAIEE